MSVSALEEKRQAVKSNRVVHVYDLPKSMYRDGLAKKVGMRELSPDEEIRASKLGRLDYMRAQYEAVKISICQLDGKDVVNAADGEVDVFWNRLGPKGRSLILQAYNKLTSPSEDETVDFFTSEVVSV